jgi:hypothetical protein
MNKHFAAKALNDSVKLSKIEALCDRILAESKYYMERDIAEEILNIIQGEN